MSSRKLRSSSGLFWSFIDSSSQLSRQNGADFLDVGLHHAGHCGQPAPRSDPAARRFRPSPPGLPSGRSPRRLGAPGPRPIGDAQPLARLCFRSSDGQLKRTTHSGQFFSLPPVCRAYVEVVAVVGPLGLASASAGAFSVAARWRRRSRASRAMFRRASATVRGVELGTGFFSWDRAPSAGVKSGSAVSGCWKQ